MLTMIFMSGSIEVFPLEPARLHREDLEYCCDEKVWLPGFSERRRTWAFVSSMQIFHFEYGPLPSSVSSVLQFGGPLEHTQNKPHTLTEIGYVHF